MSATDPTSVVVNIYNKNYTIALGPDQTAEQVQRVAQLVDETMRQIDKQHPSPLPLQTAILAGLDLVDELFQLRDDYQTAESDIAQRTSRLVSSLGRIFEQVQVNAIGSEES